MNGTAGHTNEERMVDVAKQLRRCLLSLEERRQRRKILRILNGHKRR